MKVKYEQMKDNQKKNEIFSNYEYWRAYNQIKKKWNNPGNTLSS